jgi:osmotically inducible protein OsmC
MSTDRFATAVWHGDLASGSGRVSLDSSKTGSFDVSWPRRTEEPEGKTSPEELIAAAHSSCYCMQFSALLARNGTPPEEITASAKVTFGRTSDGWGIQGSALTVRAVVPGLDAETFAKIADQAKLTCPVSAALTGTTITLDAALA